MYLLKLTHGCKEKLKVLNKERLLLIAAFAAVYIIWGSTYFSIKIAIQTLPPMLMAATRFIIAGSFMILVAVFTGAQKPRIKTLKDSAILGFLLLLMGNGGVVWASGSIPSSIIALLITVEPIWIVLLVMLKRKGNLPDVNTVLGVITGLAGTIMLVAPGINGQFSLNPGGLIGVFLSTICWALGSLYAVKAGKNGSAMMSTGLQMLFGGLFLLIAGMVRGEWLNIQPENFSPESVLAFLYLIFFGSIVGYSAYSYLLKVATPSQVSTYAYVNPLVAVLLGTFAGDEPFTLQIAIAAILLLAGVILVLSRNTNK